VPLFTNDEMTIVQAFEMAEPQHGGRLAPKKCRHQTARTIMND